MIRLITVSPELEAAANDGSAFEAITEESPSESIALLRNILAQGAAHRVRTNGSYAWGGFIAVTTTDAAVVVGFCAFVAAPNEEGEVEIAYFTAPPFEGCGYGTAMAGALIDRAIASGAVRLIYANTLPEGNASTSILAHHGFEQTGIAHDDDAGEVWRWERALT